MSIKVNTFQKLIGRPLNTHNFFISIPQMQDITLLVSATTFPTEKLGTKTLFYQGEPTYFPTTPQRGGTWSCTISEGEFAKSYKSASLSFKINFLQNMGVMNFFSLLDKFDIVVGSKTIDAGVHQEYSTSPFSVSLKDCFLLGMEPVSLNAGSVTQAWAWNLSFQYDSLVYSKADFIGKLTPDLTRGVSGVMDSVNFVTGLFNSGNEKHPLPKAPNLPELEVGKNELLKQGVSPN